MPVRVDDQTEDVPSKGPYYESRMRTLGQGVMSYKVLPFHEDSVVRLSVLINDWLEDPVNAGWEVKFIHYQVDAGSHYALVEVEKWR